MPLYPLKKGQGQSAVTPQGHIATDLVEKTFHEASTDAYTTPAYNITSKSTIVKTPTIDTHKADGELILSALGMSIILTICCLCGGFLKKRKKRTRRNRYDLRQRDLLDLNWIPPPPPPEYPLDEPVLNELPSRLAIESNDVEQEANPPAPPPLPIQSDEIPRPKEIVQSTVIGHSRKSNTLTEDQRLAQKLLGGQLAGIYVKRKS